MDTFFLIFFSSFSCHILPWFSLIVYCLFLFYVILVSILTVVSYVKICRRCHTSVNHDMLSHDESVISPITKGEQGHLLSRWRSWSHTCCCWTDCHPRTELLTRFSRRCQLLRGTVSLSVTGDQPDHNSLRCPSVYNLSLRVTQTSNGNIKIIN